MNHEGAIKAIRQIWVSCLVALFIVNSNMIIHAQPIDIANVIITAIIAGAAVLISGAIWGISEAGNNNESLSSDEKLKRGERVERLIQLMEADELYELRQRLQENYREPQADYMLGDDGELLQKKSRRA